jgi:8-amino-7-oxononanoate synthase
MTTGGSSSDWGCVPSEGSGAEGARRQRPEATRALADLCQTRLEERAREGLLRVSPCPAPAAEGAPWIIEDGRRLLGFASNDYLGLARDPRLARAAAAAIERHGTGAGAAGLLGGRSTLHAELECALADWLGQEAAVVLPSGFQANLAAQSFLGRGEVVLHDRLNHASLLAASVLARARPRRHRHADPAHCARMLRASDARLLVTETLFGMDGDAAPLAALAEIARDHRVPLLVDEAHALGVLGPEGNGLAAGLPPAGRPAVIIGTFGKALGSQGACVAGPAPYIEYLRQAAPPAVYTTALAPAAVAATLAALRCVREEPERRLMLRERVQQFAAATAGLAPLVARPEGAIVCLQTGDARRATALSRALAEAGFRVPAIRPPTVPAGQSRLRISITSSHTAAHVQALAEALVALWPLSGRCGAEPGPEGRA